nr:hypothetical protein [uncultured Haemophilus sp.]
MCNLNHHEKMLFEQIDQQIDKSDNPELCYQFLNLKLELIKHLNQQEINLQNIEIESRKLDDSFNSRIRRPYHPANRTPSLF